MQDVRLHELKMSSIAADAAEARCLLEEHFKVHIKLLRQDKGGVIAATGVAATAIAAVKLAPKAIPIVKEKAPEIAKEASDVAKVIIRKLSSLLEPCWNLLEPVGPSKLTVHLLSQAQQNAFTRTLLELTRICGAELALLASPEICFGADLAPWSTVVICDCQRAKSVCLYSAHSAPIQLQKV